MKKRLGLTIGATLLGASAMLATAAPGDNDRSGMLQGMQGMGMSHGMGMNQGMGMGLGMGTYDRIQGAMGMRMLERLDWALELTSEQRQQVRNLIKQHQQSDPESMQGMGRQLQDLDPGSDDYQQQLEELARQRAEQMEQRLLQRGRLHGEIYDLLTPEQRQAWKRMHAQRGPGPGRGQWQQ